MKSKIKIIIGSIILLLALAASIFAYQLYQRFFKPAVKLQGIKSTYLYIASGTDYNTLYQDLQIKGWVKDMQAFNFLAQRKNYPQKIKAGRYEIEHGMNLNSLINRLRSGSQSPVNVTFNNINYLEQLAGKVAEKIEADSVQIIEAIRNTDFLAKYDIKDAHLISRFIPNTYQVFWNTSAEEFVDRMQNEYNKFWNKKRLQQAENIKFTPEQIATIASIVQKETNKTDEMSRIAGVYINRVQKDWPLQADPTLKYALGDWTIRRVTDADKMIVSPYNTYQNTGIPPGPICMPSPTAIDKVLNYERHQYMYFCAKDDFSGYHAFAKTLRQHNRNAAKYHRALNKRRIYR